MKKNRVLFFSIFLSLALMTGAAMAAYPTKPVVLITHSSPGAGGDIFSGT